MTTKTTPAGSQVSVAVDSLGEAFVMQTTTAAPATGDSCAPIKKDRSFSATLTTSAGNGSATILWEVSNDLGADANKNWILMATTTFALAACPQTDGFASNVPWAYVRSRVTAIAGTNAKVVTTLGI